MSMYLSINVLLNNLNTKILNLSKGKIYLEFTHSFSINLGLVVHRCHNNGKYRVRRYLE